MKRYYVCPVIGDGTEENAYRPKVADYNVSWTGLLSTDPQGLPKKAWSLVLVDTVDHTAILADGKIFALPDSGLDTTFGSLSPAERNRVRNYLGSIDIDTTWITNNTPLREIVRAVGLQHVDTFNENNFDVVDG